MEPAIMTLSSGRVSRRGHPLDDRAKPVVARGAPRQFIQSRGRQCGVRARVVRNLMAVFLLLGQPVVVLQADEAWTEEEPFSDWLSRRMEEIQRGEIPLSLSTGCCRRGKRAIPDLLEYVNHGSEIQRNMAIRQIRYLDRVLSWEERVGHLHIFLDGLEDKFLHEVSISYLEEKRWSEAPRTAAEMAYGALREFVETGGPFPVARAHASETLAILTPLEDRSEVLGMLERLQAEFASRGVPSYAETSLLVAMGRLGSPSVLSSCLKNLRAEDPQSVFEALSLATSIADIALLDEVVAVLRREDWDPTATEMDIMGTGLHDMAWLTILTTVPEVFGIRLEDNGAVPPIQLPAGEVPRRFWAWWNEEGQRLCEARQAVLFEFPLTQGAPNAVRQTFSEEPVSLQSYESSDESAERTARDRKQPWLWVGLALGAMVVLACWRLWGRVRCMLQRGDS